MKATTWFMVFGCASQLLVTSAMRAADAPTVPLELVQTIPLPGVKGRLDHFAADTQRKRLFVAALGNDSLEVVDLGAGKSLKSISGLHKPTGIVFLPDVNQIGVANGNDSTFKLFDGNSYALVNNLEGLDDADNVRLDAKMGEIYVGFGDGALAILDKSGRKKTGEVKLKAHPESFQVEKGGSRVFVNATDAKQIAVIDREKKSVVMTWPLEKFQANFPMALDESGHRLFVGCRKPARLIIFDTESGKPVADLAISDDTDDLFFDAKRGRIYVSCGEGFIDVIQRSAGDRYERVGRQPTRPGARTCLFSPDLDRLYLAVPQHSGQNAEIRAFMPR